MANYRKFSDEQIALANSVDLVDYLRDQGEVLIKSGKDFRWQRYTSVTIRDNRWFRFKGEQTGGYPIQFLKEFYGYGFKEAVELLLSYANDTGLTEVKVRQEEEPKEFVLPEKNATMRNVYAYLLKTRYIDKDVLDEFVKAGLIYEDTKYHNVVFVGADEDGIARHAHKRSTYTKAERQYRGNVEGSNPSYSFHYIGKSNQLYVFEAPIDMLSYISLHKENWQQHSYVALCGLGMQSMEHILENNENINFINVGTDHDIAGQEGAERIFDRLQELGYAFLGRVLPKYKDFNEDLRANQGCDAQKGIDSPNYQLMDTMIEKIQNSVHAIPNEQIEYKELGKAFANMYYGLNHNDKGGKGDYQRIQNDFMKISECALQLAHKNLYSASFDFRSPVFDSVKENYRSYLDKGNLEKRIERIKLALQDVKKMIDQNVSNIEIGKGYLNLATESTTMMMECERQLSQKMVQEEPTIEKKRPEAKLIGANGNIFNLIGIASNVLKSNGMEEQAKEMFQRITESESYSEALAIINEYVEPVDVDDIEMEEPTMQLNGHI